MLLHAKTRYGEVQGTSSSVAGVAVFRGVPYAKPPVGELRWRAPEKPEAWDGVLKCEKFRAAAMQTKATMPFYVKEFPIDYSQIAIHEDCLYLNIWTPAVSASDKLPVMVYFHGGGDVTGFPHEPEHDGTRLAEKQVIYVNVTYRLNVFGFLAHPELTAESAYGASGNYGLLDQAAALRWVRENIAAFGGDPDTVTIFGQSAGAGNVHAHCVSPLTKGLFRRAISVSGSGVVSLMRAGTLRDEEQKGLAFQEACSCNSLKELRGLPEAMILAYMVQSRINCAFCIDNYYLLEEPSAAIIHGRHHDVDIMAGSCANEGATFGYGYRNTMDGFRGAVASFFPGVDEIAWKLYDIHSDEEAARSDADVMADGAVFGTHYWAKVHNKLGRKPLYVYYFCRKLPDREGNPSEEGSFHSGDLWYIHGTLDRSWRAFGEADYRLSDLEMRYFTNFAKNADPNGGDLPEWTPFTPEKPCTMLLCDSPRMDAMEKNVGMMTALQAE